MGIAVYHESFHQGVVGIVAGRLRENFIALRLSSLMHLRARRTEGSARSIDGLNIRLAGQHCNHGRVCF